jgi:hypothetical protein
MFLQLPFILEAISHDGDVLNVVVIQADNMALAAMQGMMLKVKERHTIQTLQWSVKHWGNYVIAIHFGKKCMGHESSLYGKPKRNLFKT